MSCNQAYSASLKLTFKFKLNTMKRILILLAFLTIGSFTLLAQGPPPVPPTTGNNGGANNFVGGTNGPSGGPIGNGTFILLTLAAAYAGRKVYAIKATETQE
jgi:hypothetical protein